MLVSWPPHTGDLIYDLEQRVAHERELGVWEFPHFVRYLRALIFKLTPQPHRCTLRALDAAKDVLTKDEPAVLTGLLSDVPRREGRGRASRTAANVIIYVIGCWAGWDLQRRVKFRETPNEGAEESAYECAKAYVRDIEQRALEVGLTATDFYECAVDAFSSRVIEATRRDAAVAAMAAGHFRLGYEIATGVDG